MSDSDLCKQCGLLPIQDCVAGSIKVDEYRARECPNLKRLRVQGLLMARLTPELQRAPKITESPLYIPGKTRGMPAVVNRTRDNLFIRGVTIGQLRPHLRLIFSCLPVRYNLVDDSGILNVWVGSQAYRSKPTSERDRVPTFNSIPDYVGARYGLVVIQLGKMGWKNVAASGVLLEALMHRESLDLPTWLFEDRSAELSWQHSRDSSVEQYVKTRFEDFPLEPGGPESEEEEHFSIDEPDQAYASPAEQHVMVPRDEPAPYRGQVNFDDDIGGLMGGGDQSKNRYNKKKSWKK